MRDPARIPVVLEALRKTWERSPDLRLGQLIFNLVWPNDGFHVEDDQMLSRLNKRENEGATDAR